MLGGNINEFDVKETNRRVLQYFRELSVKRAYNRFTTFKSDTDEMIIGNHLRLYSVCEHHLLPFFGEVAIGYIPNGKIFGLSKFQRIVDKVASRPQLQERLTKEIAEFINVAIHPLGIGVVIRAIHTCVFARGVQSANAEFTTNVMLGNFRNKAETRSEFFASIADSRLKL